MNGDIQSYPDSVTSVTSSVLRVTILDSTARFDSTG